MSFYDQFSEVKKNLEEMGHTVLAPELEFETKEEDILIGDTQIFPPEHGVWKRKGKAITVHFRKIDESDCVLITNYEKKGNLNYIGGNTFLEIGYAYGNGKKIFILNAIPEQSGFKEEILGMQPVVLGGDITKINIL